MLGLVPAEMFRFTTGAQAPLYTAILSVFADANERLVTALSLDDVSERLSGVGWFGELDDAALAVALTYLRDSGLVDAVQNHASSYRTAVEYERSNFQYSLTRRGEAAFAGLQAALAALESSGALQTAVLDAIADRLHALVALQRDPGSSDRRIFTVLQELEGHLEGLRANTKQFNGELQRLLVAEDVDESGLEVFREVKAATIAYLQEFVSRLDQRAAAIARELLAAEELDVDRLRVRALVGAELPPLVGADPGPAWLEVRRARWDGLRAWFLPVDGSVPRVEQLHDVARRAIVVLLQVLERISQARRRPSSVAEDFRAMARGFAAASDEEGLCRLWSAGFGMGPARHAHLVHPDPEVVPAGVAWGDAPAVEVSALLRSSGRTQQMSRPGRVRDVSGVREARALRARAEREQLEAAWALLRTRGPVRLSQFAVLEFSAFSRLLDLLGAALQGPVVDGVRRGETSDGRVELLLRAPVDGVVVELVTSRGVLRGPDFVVEVRQAGAAAVGGVL